MATSVNSAAMVRPGFAGLVQFGEAIARHSRRGWRIDKPNLRANIDAMIALAMAVERAEQVPEPVELVGWL
jgi:hypothetical protein